MQSSNFTLAAHLCAPLVFSLVTLATPVAIGSAAADPATNQRQEYTSDDTEAPDTVGRVHGKLPGPSKAANDTIWIADWSFDGAGGCTSAGWTQYDLRILNVSGSPSSLDVDGHPVWTVIGDFSGQGLISGNAAQLGIRNLCWCGDGYGDNWDYSIRVLYRGTTTLEFDYKTDTEVCCDFMRVEADSACSSFARVNYSIAPNKQPSAYRQLIGSPASGTTLSGSSQHFTGTLPDFGTPATTHCAYIRFVSNGSVSAESPDDGMVGCSQQFGGALVVDNVRTTGGAISVNEGFAGALDPNVSFVNTAPTTPFGQWARVYQHITDNDKCTENTTCAWLWSDPTLLEYPGCLECPPGMGAIRNWLDDAIVSPWASLASTPTATGTLLSFRRFFGNYFQYSKIAQNWSFRSHSRIENIITTDPTDSIDCITPWAHASSWATGGAASTWSSSVAFATQYIATGAREIQVRWRVSDWQYLMGDSPPSPWRTGPGPYLDRVRIGRRVLSGPYFDEGIDARTQAQDCFATVPMATGPGTGEHFQPSTDRHGTCAFSMGEDLRTGRPHPRIVVGDSIPIRVTDVRAAGGINSVQWYGAIVSGPHAGKVPAPYAVGANGFFAVPGDSCRNSVGTVIVERYFVDMDDTYFRGGDTLLYFWVATDVGGGFTSDPPGMTALPASSAEAEAATGGLLEVSFLPDIAWAPAYLVRIANDAHGDFDPTPAELAASHQARCILYDELVNFRRPSGDVNRTSMMYTLDRLGYRGAYDVYDQMGYGSTNNQLGGRAAVAQATGYALIVQDNGRATAFPTLPDGISADGSQIVDQAQWYRDYLASGSLSEIGSAALWIVSENTVNERKTNPLIATDMGITLVSNDQGLAANPNVVGQTSFTFANGSVTNFVGDKFSLSGGCPTIRNYDALGTSGTAVATHKYKAGSTLGPGAVVMNRNVSLKWNTTLAAFAWFDIRDASGNLQGTPPYGDPANPSPEAVLLSKVLGGVLPANCVRTPNPVDVAGVPPLVTALYQNVPNPFNPTTRISLDLAQQGQVEIRIFDVVGQVVRRLVDGPLPAGRHVVIWNGLDKAGRSVASGVYFCQLVTADLTLTRKLVVLR